MMVGERTRKAREYRGPMPSSVLIRARSPSKNNPERLIMENRRKNEALDETVRLVGEQRKRDRRVEWEHDSSGKALLGDIRGEIDRRLKIHGFTVDERRDRLREMLRQEEQDYVAAMEEKEETVLERQVKLRARIKSLREKKEHDRLQIVQKKYDQQFREQCDELRSTMSKREQDMVCAERLEQLKEKEEMAKERRAQDAMFDQLWEQDRQQKMAREEREAIEAQERNKEFLDSVLKQQAALDDQKKEAQRLKEEEHQLLKEQEALRQHEEEAARQEKRRRQQEAKDMWDMSLRTKLRKKAREEQEQLAYELKMLEQLLEETRIDQQERQQRKMELREEDRRYRQYLAELMEEERQRHQELERHLQQQLDADYQKELERFRTENHMRKVLLQKVIDARNKQIQDRLAENERHKAAVAKEHAEFLQRIEAERQHDEQEALKRHANNVKYQDDLLQQIRHNEELDEEQRQFRHYEYLMGLQAEKEYQEKLKDVLDNPPLERLHPMRRAMMKAERMDL